MTKNQFRQLAKKAGVSTNYSGHTKTFYLSGNTEDVNNFIGAMLFHPDGMPFHMIRNTF